MKILKLLSLFSGIGAFEKALDNLEVDYELIGYCEIDKYASKSYAAIHDIDESMNLGDVTKIDTKTLSKDIDLITYGFPCQDISLAGKQKGLLNEDGTQTRSGLFFEALRIIEETQPKIAIAENVKNLTGKKFKEQFEIVLSSLEEAGYNNYWQVLNAKDFGIPQNRERVFIVSIRKDIDDGNFKFPEGFPLELKLKDMLESTVGDKFYLSTRLIDTLVNYKTTHRAKGNGCGGNRMPKVLVEEATKKGYAEAEEGNSINFEQPEGAVVAVAMRGRYNQEGKVEQRIELSDREIANAITTVQKDSLVAEKNMILNKYFLSDKGAKYVLDPKRGMCTDINEDICQTLTAKGQNNWTGSFISPDINTIEKSPIIGSKEPTKIFLNNGEILTSEDDLRGIRIRRLTPKECFRLMGFDDEDFQRAAAVNSNTQLYKQAGNSIVVNVLGYIFSAIFEYIKLD